MDNDKDQCKAKALVSKVLTKLNGSSNTNPQVKKKAMKRLVELMIDPCAHDHQVKERLRCPARQQAKNKYLPKSGISPCPIMVEWILSSLTSEVKTSLLDALHDQSNPSLQTETLNLVMHFTFGRVILAKLANHWPELSDRLAAMVSTTKNRAVLEPVIKCVTNLANLNLDFRARFTTSKHMEALIALPDRADLQRNPDFYRAIQHLIFIIISKNEDDPMDSKLPFSVGSKCMALMLRALNHADSDIVMGACVCLKSVCQQSEDLLKLVTHMERFYPGFLPRLCQVLKDCLKRSSTPDISLYEVMFIIHMIIGHDGWSSQYRATLVDIIFSNAKRLMLESSLEVALQVVCILIYLFDRDKAQLAKDHRTELRAHIEPHIEPLLELLSTSTNSTKIGQLFIQTTTNCTNNLKNLINQLNNDQS